MSVAPPTTDELTAPKVPAYDAALKAAAANSTDAFIVALRQHVAELEKTMTLTEIREALESIMEKEYVNEVSFGGHIRTMTDPDNLAFCMRYHVFYKNTDFWTLAERLFESKDYDRKFVESWRIALQEHDRYVEFEEYEYVRAQHSPGNVSQRFYSHMLGLLGYENNRRRYSTFLETCRRVEAYKKATMPVYHSDNKNKLELATWANNPQLYFAGMLTIARMMEMKQVPYYAIVEAMKSMIGRINTQANFQDELEKTELDIVRCILHYDLVADRQPLIARLPEAERVGWH